MLIIYLSVKTRMGFGHSYSKPNLLMLCSAISNKNEIILPEAKLVWTDFIGELYVRILAGSMFDSTVAAASSPPLETGAVASSSPSTPGAETPLQKW